MRPRSGSCLSTVVSFSLALRCIICHQLAHSHPRNSSFFAGNAAIFMCSCAEHDQVSSVPSSLITPSPIVTSPFSLIIPSPRPKNPIPSTSSTSNPATFPQINGQALPSNPSSPRRPHIHRLVPPLHSQRCRAAHPPATLLSSPHP